MTTGRFGFFPAAGTNYSVGNEPEIAKRLDQLAVAKRLHITGLSGFRSPQHSVAVGGFPNDPHTKGAASDSPGVESVPESVLNQFGLTRPFPGAAEADHIQLLAPKQSNAAKVALPGPLVTAIGDIPGAGPGLKAIIQGGQASPVVKSAEDAAAGAAQDAAGGLVSSLAGALGIHGDRILLYVALILGGAVLAASGVARAAGVTSGDVRKAAAAGAAA